VTFSLVAALVLTQNPVPSFELERLRLNPAAQSTLVIDTADLMGGTQLRVGLTGHYQHDPLVVVDSASKRAGSVVRSRLGFHLTGAYGITRWLDVGVQVPLVVWQAGDDLSAFRVTPIAGSVALGTPWLNVRGAPLQQSRGAPLDLSIGLGVGLPLGSEAALTRDATVTAAPSLSAGRVLAWSDGREFLRVGGGFTAMIRPARVLTMSSQIADEVGSYGSIGVGAAWLGLPVKPELSVRLDVPFTRSPVGAELMLGLRSPRVGPVEFYAIGGPGFGQQPGTPSFRVLAGAALAADLAPKPAPITLDPCLAASPPAECPDGDADGDGVRNVQDACRLVMGVAALKGCPDVDSDGDGVLDSADTCPGVKGPASRKGCPAPDADQDGLDDDADRCPAIAGTAAFFGCPDSDADGVEDSKDGCPAEAGLLELKGCPDKDTDGDGVVDRLDGCLTAKGPSSNQGCPAKEKQLVIITRERLVIRDKVYFDSGKSVVLPRSMTLLQQIARVLKEHPEIERVSIEGHTDDRGERGMNLKLSEARAASVREVLVKAGVEPTRISSKGFGPERPVMPNTSAAGREVNRRVEFVIVGAETEGPPVPAK
jgi:outer membrane protein OmpA-like peptidoglycan-associated protein